MSLQAPGHKSKRMRHRIIEIELEPSTSDRPISAKVLVNDKVVCELPWIKSGRPLRWARLVIYDGSDDSKVMLEVYEKHSIKDRRFRSNVYIISSVQQLTEVTVGFVGLTWNATFRLLTPVAAEKSFAAGIAKLRQLQDGPSTLDRLGKARPVFEAMLQFGSEISEIHPTAKMVFMICTKAWEKLEAQEQYNENVRDLLDGLGGILEFVQIVKKHAQTENLQGTIGEFLTLVEDVSLCAAERAEVTNNQGRIFRGLLEPRERDRTKLLLSRFERLRAELDIGIAAETHKEVHEIGKKMYIMDLHGQLSQLQPVTPSGYDSARACQEGTREGIISNIVSWSEQSTPSECMLWVHGQAGIGKSSIATSVCRHLAKDKVLAASFFCKRDDSSLRDPLRLINSVAHGLATRYPPYGEAVAAAIQEDRELCTAHMDVRYEGLIKKPLQSLEHSSMGRPLVILIDALDECGTHDTRRNLLAYLLEMSKLVSWLKLIVTSRPDGDVHEFFRGSNRDHMSLCNVHSFDASGDIRAYIQKELGEIARRHQWDAGGIDQLCEKAGGVFIWAATVKKYLTGFRGSTIPRLQKVLNDQRSTVSDHLDTLYRSVILEGMRDTEEDQKAIFRRCIGTIVIASKRQPLSTSSIGSLLLGQLDLITLEEVVTSLDAVLHIDKHLSNAVRVYHPSFADYATDLSRSGDLYVFPDERNTELALGCLRTMERELRFNICELETSYLLNGQVPDLAERIESNISDQLRYACTYWTSHLIDTPKGTLTSELEVLIHSPRVLYWLEVLSLLGRVEIGLQGLLELQDWLKSNDMLLECVEDLHRFTSAFYDPISSSAPHIYVSALALAPRSAQVVRRFGSLFPNAVTVISGRDTDWPRWQSTLPHHAEVKSIAVSSNGHLLASGSFDDMVHIWDVRSGTILGRPLSGHSSYVSCVALSSDGSRVVSGSADKSLRLWDTKAGVAIGEPLLGHTGVVDVVVFSPDDNRIASGSADKTIRIWDSTNGAAVGDPLLGHSSGVLSLAFSPDGRYLLSGSVNHTVLVWDAKTYTIIRKLPVHARDSISYYAAFSPGGSRIAYCLDRYISITHWNTDTGEIIGKPLVQPCGSVAHMAFSPDGHRIIVGTHDGTVEIWNIEGDRITGNQLIGHSGAVLAVAFLPDGRRAASGSLDKTVRLWDIRYRAGAVVDRDEPLTMHSAPVVSVAFSPDGTRIASGSDDTTIRLWDANTGSAIGEPLSGHSGTVRGVLFSPDGNYIISRSDDHTLRVWDATNGAATGELLVTPPMTVRSLAFSPNSMHIALGSEDGSVTVAFADFLVDHTRTDSSSVSVIPRWSTKTTTAVTATCQQSIHHLDFVCSLVFSHDGSYLASGSNDKTIRLWDAKTGVAFGKPLVGHSDTVISIVFSSDNSHVISCCSDMTVRWWDTRLATMVSESLLGQSRPFRPIALSPNGNLVASGAPDRVLKLWDSKTGAVIADPFVGHTMPVGSVAFSPDSGRVVSGSWDGSMRIWSAKTGTDEPDSAEPSYPQRQTLPEPSVRWPPNTYALPSHPEHRSWVSFDGHSLLLWLPGHYRRDYSPTTLCTISTSLSESVIRLDFSKFAHGSSWASVACDKIK